MLQAVIISLSILTYVPFQGGGYPSFPIPTTQKFREEGGHQMTKQLPTHNSLNPSPLSPAREWQINHCSMQPSPGSYSPSILIPTPKPFLFENSLLSACQSVLQASHHHPQSASGLPLTQTVTPLQGFCFGPRPLTSPGSGLSREHPHPILSTPRSPLCTCHLLSL